MQLQVLLDEFGERDRAAAAGTDPIERLPERLLRLRPAREPTHLRPRRTSSLEPISVRPQPLTVRALRRQLEHLPLLDQLKPSSIDNWIEESDRVDHLSHAEGVRVGYVWLSNGCWSGRTRRMNRCARSSWSRSDGDGH